MATQHDRPLSPHLQIYKWQWTMTLSILHRFTGLALALGALYLVCWLTNLASGAQPFAELQAFQQSVLGRILLIGWSWALFYHFANGIRHLVWDAGHGYTLPVARASGYAVAAASVVLTAALWLAVLA